MSNTRNEIRFRQSIECPIEMMGQRPTQYILWSHICNQMKPLHKAVCERHLDNVKMNLDHGADPNEILKCCNRTPLDFIINDSIQLNIDIIELLIQKGAKLSVNCIDKVFEYFSCCENIKIDKKFHISLLKCTINSQNFYQMKNGKCIDISQSILFHAFNNKLFYLAKLILLNSDKPNYYIGYEGIPKHYSIPFYCLTLEPFKFTFILTKLRLLKEFGANFWVKEEDENTKEETCMLRYLYTHPGMRHVPAKDFEQMEEMIKNPLNLQKLCRLSIKQQMGCNYTQNISSLPLPKTMLDFLTFNDIFALNYTN